MADSTFFQIPGNIKQQFQPFVLNPGAKLNSEVASSRDLQGGVDPQYFTYKSNSKYMYSGKGQLCFYPSSMKSQMVNDDLSFKLLYGHDYQSGECTKKSITVQDILNTIPGVQIREFLPDTRLDQCINLFADMFKNMTKLFTGDDDEKNANNASEQVTKSDQEDSIFKKIIEASWFTVKYMVGAYPKGNPSFINDMGSSFAGVSFSNYNNSQTDVGQRVMTFPYALYYRLQSCVTTNIFEVPAVSTDKTILKSGGGMAGWTDGGDIFSSGGFRLSGLLGKIPIVGSLANMILGNIGINYMPWWNAESGTKVKEPQIEIKFDLYNDSAEAAMINFIFVNTLVSGNKFVQYGMFQHSSNIYDVKIEGINRLFACAGDFTVTYEGVLRDPPKSWVDTLVDKYGNTCINKGTMKANILNNKMIKIPDVYRVSMQFQSLLPASFNNYIFNYAENNSHIETYYTKVYDQSGLSEAIPGALAKYTGRVKKVWKAADENAGK